MKALFSLTIAVFLFAGISGCNQAGSGTETKKEESVPAKEAKYICPMKCEGGTSDKPGKCPVCEMDLVESASLKGAVTPADSHTTHSH